jgi:hypothetical protein
MRASNFAGIPKGIIEDYTKYESDVIVRYTANDLKGLSKRIFDGIY